MEEYLHFLLHCILYPFICANKALRLRSSLTWRLYCLICRFLSNVLLTIVLRFVLFISAIVLSVSLRLTAINNPFDIFGSFYYTWVWVICLVFLIILQFLTKDKITKYEHKWLVDWMIDWLSEWLVFNGYFIIIAAISWRWTHIIYVMNPLHIIVSDCCLTPCE